MLVVLSIILYAAPDKNFARVQFKKEAAELKIDIDQLKFKYDVVTNDLHKYKKTLNSISVPYECLVTNVIVVSSKYYTTNIVKKVYTPYERKIRRLLMSFDSKELEIIYLKYYPEDNFKRLKAELKEDFHELKSSHAEMMKNRRNRRRSTSARIAELNRTTERLIKQKTKEFQEEIRILNKYISTSEKSIGFHAARANAVRVMRKYNVNNPESAKNILTARLNSLRDTDVLDSRFKVADAVREEANTDVDEESEERFKQDKIACILRYYDKISSNFIDTLERAKADITKEMYAKMQRTSALTMLLDNWDMVDDNQIAKMNEDTIAKILDTVNGVGFSDKVKQAEENERLAKIEERENIDRAEERRLELDMRRRTYLIAEQNLKEDLETKRISNERARIENSAYRSSMVVFSGVDPDIWDFKINGLSIFDRDINEFRRIATENGWICGSQLPRPDSSYAMSVKFPGGMNVFSNRFRGLAAYGMDVKVNSYERICGIRLHLKGYDNSIVSKFYKYFHNANARKRSDLLYVAATGFYGYPCVDIVRKDIE
jgi:hypothetical protein